MARLLQVDGKRTGLLKRHHDRGLSEVETPPKAAASGPPKRTHFHCHIHLRSYNALKSGCDSGGVARTAGWLGRPGTTLMSRFIALLSVLLVDTIVQLLDICEINGCPK
jgi:hypothetical protein